MRYLWFRPPGGTRWKSALHTHSLPTWEESINMNPEEPFHLLPFIKASFHITVLTSASFRARGILSAAVLSGFRDQSAQTALGLLCSSCGSAWCSVWRTARTTASARMDHLFLSVSTYPLRSWIRAAMGSCLRLTGLISSLLERSFHGETFRITLLAPSGLNTRPHSPTKLRTISSHEVSKKISVFDPGSFLLQAKVRNTWTCRLWETGD